MKKKDLKVRINGKFNQVKESLKITIKEMIRKKILNVLRNMKIVILVIKENVAVSILGSNEIYFEIAIIAIVTQDVNNNVLVHLTPVVTLVDLLKELKLQSLNLIKKLKTNLKFQKKFIDRFPKEKTLITNQNKDPQFEIKNKCIQMKILMVT